ncbi:DUF7544 domain-containing protein [Salinirubrum litoreum]|uniref:DUF7847 domain-containing protein n=1 Tax=Salinirubrum litoreum TaxID=1126234 RepID=A0ABD5R8U0_9EURY|nr:hypothetical protein [Salinirubrum litoreum]
MAVLSSLRTALGSLVSNPVLFVASFLIGLVTLPQSALSLLGIPLAPTLLQLVTYFITPFLLAGLIGMAIEAQADGTAFGTLTREGKENYVPLLLGTLLRTAIQFAFGIVVFLFGIVAFVVGIGGAGAISEGGLDPGALLGSLGLVFVAFLLFAVLPYLVVMVLIQFFPVAIVAEDRDVIEAFKRSYGVVRSNVLPTVGYSIVSFGVALIAAAPVTAFTLSRTLSQIQSAGAGGTTPTGGGFGGAGAGSLSLFSPVEVVIISAMTLVLTTVLLAFQQSYAVAFFQAVRD